MVKVGVTGGIGSGKSLVCSIIESMGFLVYHADIEAKKLTDTHPAIINGIVDLFGKDIYINGILDRKQVGKLVFGNDLLLAKLNAIIHPVVGDNFAKWTQDNSEHKILFKEAAILFESGASQWVDKVVAVWASQELRIKRVMQRDGVSELDVRKRMQHQLSEKDLLNRSDYVITNDEESLLIPQVSKVVNDLILVNG